MLWLSFNNNTTPMPLWNNRHSFVQMLFVWMMKTQPASWQRVFDVSSLTVFQNQWCVAIDVHWNKLNLNSLPSFYFTVARLPFSTLGDLMLGTNICPCLLTVIIDLCAGGLRVFIVISPESGGPFDLWGGSLLCPSLTTHGTFSHVHIWLIFNVRQRRFLCVPQSGSTNPTGS